MRLLVLGGTVFLSHAVATAALARGHQVVCVCRGASGSVPSGAELVAADRSTGPLPDVGRIDAVVDVARTPSWVREAVAAYATAHWVFVSTINVYPDTSTPGGSPASLTLHDPLPGDVDADDPEAYGRMKVACEEAVVDGAASAVVVRPGLIVGPGDPTGRYSYWPRRLAAVDETPRVLAPGNPADPVQVIDVRDLAAWSVDLAERRRSGVYDAVGPVLSIADLLSRTALGVGAEPDWRWVPHGRLADLGVQPWSGADAVPLWLPRPEYDGMLAHDPAPAAEAGLRVRPLAETARDTLAWLDAVPGAPVTGIDSGREQALLAAADRVDAEAG